MDTQTTLSYGLTSKAQDQQTPLSSSHSYYQAGRATCPHFTGSYHCTGEQSNFDYYIIYKKQGERYLHGHRGLDELVSVFPNIKYGKAVAAASGTPVQTSSGKVAYGAVCADDTLHIISHHPGAAQTDRPFSPFNVLSYYPTSEQSFQLSSVGGDPESGENGQVFQFAHWNCERVAENPNDP